VEENSLKFMADDKQTKVCPLCAETIKTAAKICPFCRSKQGRYALWQQRFLMAGPVAVLIIGAIAVIAQFAPNEEGAGGRSFAGHRRDLVVLNTSLDQTEKKPSFWMTGIVTNQGEYPWRVQELEVRFLDKRGNLLDVRHPDVKDTFVVQSHRENGFRVELGGLAFTNKSVTHQVRVQIATDGDRPLKPD
jgi:hypothetical protein